MTNAPAEPDARRLRDTRIDLVTECSVAGTDAETFGPFLNRRGAGAFSNELGADGNSSPGAPPFFHPVR